MMGSALQFSARTDVGRKREHNEDNFLVDKKLGLFVVCDGMGGHAAGEVASALAVRIFHEEIKREAELLDDYRAQKSGGDRVNRGDIIRMLEFAVNRASSAVHTEASRDAAKRGMGTTLVAALLVGSQAFIVYAGDSRLYLQRDGKLEQVTEDHNVFNELMRRKKLSREKVEELKQKNALTRAVGVYEHTEPDSLVLDLVSGDRLLLCSDGLSGYFEKNVDGLNELLSGDDLDGVTTSLISAANAEGGKDNITTIVIGVGDAATKDEQGVARLRLQRDLLGRVPLFRPLSDREMLRVLQVTDVLSFEDGETVIEEGAKGDELFIVLSGTVSVCKRDTQITRLAQGAHFGEMALVRRQPRSATVKSVGHSELVVIRRSDFFEILRKEHELAVKLLWQFVGVLAERLEQTSRELGHAREELAAEEVTAELSLVDEDSDFEDDDGARITLVNPPRPPPEDSATDDE
jgi:serine/threonine protein phosphatase PrpC/CRP-like cAMP-binding protein